MLRHSTLFCHCSKWRPDCAHFFSPYKMIIEHRSKFFCYFAKYHVCMKNTCLAYQKRRFVIIILPPLSSLWRVTIFLCIAKVPHTFPLDVVAVRRGHMSRTHCTHHIYTFSSFRIKSTQQVLKTTNNPAVPLPTLDVMKRTPNTYIATSINLILYFLFERKAILCCFFFHLDFFCSDRSIVCSTNT